MNSTKPAKDQMQRDFTKMSYTDINGRTSMVVQYRAGFAIEKLRDNRQSEEPIYVAFEGHQPEELSNVLEELRRYRANSNVAPYDLRRDVDSQMNMIMAANDRITKLEKPFWKKLKG